MMMVKVTYGSTEIEYRLLFCDRKTIEIAVEPDATVLVKAPHKTPLEIVETKVKKRSRWILKQQRFFEQFFPRTPERKYIGGETHLYLGRRYRLKLNETEEASIKMNRGFFLVSHPEVKKSETVKTLLYSWYRERAKERFNERLAHCSVSFPKKAAIEIPPLQIRLMRSRWGSLALSGTLTLNLDLIKAPLECIDYVIAHELCHTHHAGHSREFYDLLEKVMPDFNKRKLKLEMSLC